MHTKLISAVLVLALILSVSLTSRSSASSTAHNADRAAHKSCKYCGMDRDKFSHSRMLIEFEESATVATCSLHCTAVELANSIDKSPRTIRVADYDSRELLDAEKAIWVIGGNVAGVMSRTAKWAFGSRERAEAFVKANGGRITWFEEALKAAYEDMYTDTKMIRDKRRMMRMMQESQDKKHGH